MCPSYGGQAIIYIILKHRKDLPSTAYDMFSKKKEKEILVVPRVDWLKDAASLKRFLYSSF